MDFRRGNACLNADAPNRVVHFLSGLAIGGKEAAALRSARKGISENKQHRLLLFETPFRSADLDFDPVEVPADFIPRRGGLDLNFALAVGRHLNTHRPDIVHAYNDTAIFYVALARTLRGGDYKIVGTFHTWPSHATKGARLASRWASRHVDCIVAVSNELRTRLVTSNWVGDCAVIPNGVDLKRFHAVATLENWRTALHVPENAILVGNVARFDPIKRQSDLVEAAKILSQMGSKIVILLVGQGPLHAQIHQLARNCPNIRFLSQTDRMPDLLGSLDIFVLCSRHEAMPLVILEAMASGLPIVATRVGGIPDLTGEGESETCAILVPPEKPAAIAAALFRLESNPDLRSRLAAQALKRVQEHSFDTEWKAYQQLYAAL